MSSQGLRSTRDCYHLHGPHTTKVGSTRVLTPSIIALTRNHSHQSHSTSPSNPHSARRTTACHFPRFRSLEAFGRRPQAAEFAAPAVIGRHPKPFTLAVISCVVQSPGR